MARVSLVFVLLAGLLAAPPAAAEIISLAGSASAEVKEYRGGQVGDTDQASDQYPQTSDELPLQVVARLLLEAEDAGGVAAAQFADPLQATTANPGEFALNITLDSLTEGLTYTGSAAAEELRGVQFTSAELGAAEGETVVVDGRFYVDGAIAVFSETAAPDLAGTALTLRITITQEFEGREPNEVFFGALRVVGNASGGIDVSTEGAFPQSGVTVSDLSALVPELALFRVVVMRNLVMEYPYEAVVGEAFSFRARVEMEAAHVSGVGVLGALGIPMDSLIEVVSLTQTGQLADKMSTMLEQERAAPSGAPAFTDRREPLGLFGWCGMFGVETVFLTVGLMFATAARRSIPQCERC